MDRELISFIDNIKSKTGIALRVFNHELQPIEGEILNGEQIPKLTDEQPVQKDGRTYFSLKIDGKNLVAVIDGDGEQFKSFAFLISQLTVSGSQELKKEQFLEKLILGDIEGLPIKKLIKKFSLTDKALFAMILTTDYAKKDEVVEFFNWYNTEGDFALLMEDERIVLVKLCNQAIDDYASCAEYAEFLVRSLYEETGIKVKIGVGGIVDGLEKINVSYLQALSTIDMMDVLQEGGDVHTYKEYVLIKILGEMPKNKINYYLNFLLDAQSKEILQDQEIIKTAECFLENNLNASETSRKMYLHRNTLNYRLDKIEKSTGLNVRKFSDALTFRITTILAKLTR